MFSIKEYIKNKSVFKMLDDKATKIVNKEIAEFKNLVNNNKLFSCCKIHGESFLSNTYNTYLFTHILEKRMVNRRKKVIISNLLEELMNNKKYIKIDKSE